MMDQLIKLISLIVLQIFWVIVFFAILSAILYLMWPLIKKYEKWAGIEK